MTLEEQRAAIITALEVLQKQHAGNKYGGFFPYETLADAIFDAIGAPLVKIRLSSQYGGHYTRRGRRQEDGARVHAIICRLEGLGYIKKSKSGLAVKVIKTRDE